MRLLALVVVAFAFAGCTSNGEEYVNKLPNKDRVLVVSALGDFARVISGTDWGEDDTQFKVQSVNESIENIFEQHAKSRFNISALNRISDFKPSRLETSAWDFSLKVPNREQNLFNIASQQNASHVLIFSTYHTTDMMPYDDGFGRYQHIGAVRSLFINYAAVCSTLFNVATKKQVARNCVNNKYGATPVNKDDELSTQVEVAKSELGDMFDIIVEGLMKTSSWIKVVSIEGEPTT